MSRINANNDYFAGFPQGPQSTTHHSERAVRLALGLRIRNGQQGPAAIVVSQLLLQDAFAYHTANERANRINDPLSEATPLTTARGVFSAIKITDDLQQTSQAKISETKDPAPSELNSATSIDTTA